MLRSPRPASGRRRTGRLAPACAAPCRAEQLERRTLLAAVPAAVEDSETSVVSPAVVQIQAESFTVPLDVNQLVAAGKATITAITPFDIGGPASIFDGDNASLARSANVNPVVLEVSFTTPRTLREFRARFSHASSHRWKVEAADGAGGPWTEIVPWTNAGDSIDSVKRLAAPATASRLRLTAQRLVGDNYVHVNEWRIFADVEITSLRLSPAANQSIRQYQTKRFRAEGVASDGTVIDLTDRVTWSTNNEAVATVNAAGLVRGAGTGGTQVVATFGTLRAQASLTVQAPLQRDLNVTYIERTPRYNYDAAKNNPAPGDLVTFAGHIRNWDNVTAAAEYAWQLDGAVVETGGLADLQPNEERVVTWQWNWQPGAHRIKLVVDPENEVAEYSEVNNSVEDRTDGLAVGFWVEQSLYDYFHEKQRNLAIGSNSWEDWAQRQMAKWNEHNASSIWAGITPDGVTDRVRIDKIVVVPDGALPLNGGLPSNNPASDKTVDLMWGFEWNPSSTFYSNTTSKAADNPFYLEPSLVHEMGHARYLVDNYTWDVANNTSVTQVQIIEPTTGRAVAGTSLMPFLAFNSVLYYNQSGGVMTGPYGDVWSPHEAGALQRIAGRRAVAGNQNAPGNIGEFLNDLPASNHVRFVDGAGNPLVGAEVRWYAASAGSGYGGKTFDNTPEYTLATDADGYVHLPRDPFLPGRHKEAVIRVARGNQIWYRFFEVAEMNLEYWRGRRTDGYYTIELPLRTSPAEIDVLGFGAVPIADNDTTPSPEDSTDFGEADVYAIGAGLGAGDARGYVIRSFVIKNRGGQTLQLTGSRVSITGANALDFSIVQQPSSSLTSGVLSVLRVKFDPRAPGVRTANVSITSNDANEGVYNFAVRGSGVIGGAAVPGLKFNDLDGDGARGAGEPGLAGWTIFADLDDDAARDANEPFAVSGADGTFTLAGLPTDRITKVLELPQADWRNTFPAEGFYAFNPFIDAVQQPFVFGNTRKARITGTVFDDRNRSGAADPGEAGLSGHTLYVDLDTDSEQDRNEPAAVTDGAGNYAIDVDPGAYSLTLVSHGGWKVAGAGSNSRPVTPAPGQVLTSQDFGLERTLQNAVMFYNNSAFDGNDPAANADDDAAREVFKTPLFPGAPLPGSFQNVSSYARGLNGIMIDVGDLPATPIGGLPLSAADFSFRAGNGGDPSAWPAAPAPTDVAVRDAAGASGTDRISITFADNAIRNTWLQVTMLATPRTGLAEPQVFYFGSLVGESGDGAGPGGLRVSALDLAAVKRVLNTSAGIESRLDFNRDGRVNALDLAAVRGSLSRELQLFTAPNVLT